MTVTSPRCLVQVYDLVEVMVIFHYRKSRSGLV
jgi:hypothetical protein